jgi:hypothetical protein
MSWDASIVRIRGQFRPVEELAKGDFLPLGSPDEVAAALRAAFPLARWAPSGSQCVVEDERTGVYLEFDLRLVASHQALSVSARGDGNPVPPLLALAKANGWAVIDDQSGAFINAENPSTDTWSNFRSVRDSLTGAHSAPPTKATRESAPSPAFGPTASEVGVNWRLVLPLILVAGIALVMLVWLRRRRWLGSL